MANSVSVASYRQLVGSGMPSGSTCCRVTPSAMMSHFVIIPHCLPSCRTLCRQMTLFAACGIVWHHATLSAITSHPLRSCHTLCLHATLSAISPHCLPSFRTLWHHATPSGIMPHPLPSCHTLCLRVAPSTVVSHPLRSCGTNRYRPRASSKGDALYWRPSIT